MKKQKKIAVADATLAIFDNRYPITIALSHALRSGLIAKEDEVVWQKRMESMVVEMAKKLGFRTVESVRGVLKTVCAIMSISLAHSTKGKKNPEAWARYLISVGLEGLVKEALVMVREVASPMEDAGFGREVSVSKEGLRSKLLDFAHPRDDAVDSDKIDRWIGYERYVSSLIRRSQDLEMKSLTEWLILHFLKLTPEEWIKQLKREYVISDASPMVQEILNTILFRYCTKLSIGRQLALKQVQFQKVRRDFERDKKKWVAEAFGRYQEIRTLIPAELHPGLFYLSDWFEAHLRKGPVKAPKKMSVAYIPHITGVYHYDAIDVEE